MRTIDERLTVGPRLRAWMRPACGRLALALIALTLAACETVPVDADAARLARERAHRVHLAWLERIDRFKGAGRLALRVPDDSMSGILDWRQDGERYDVRLSGPFGQGALRIEGAPGTVRLSTSDGHSAVAGSAEELLIQEVGWSVPVSVLRYWIVGRAAPGPTLDRVELDGDGRITRMLQAGWEVRYLDYAPVESGSLPRRLEISGPQLELRLLMTRWTTS